ncbi:MAG: hypothetical protein M1820_004979 [Bogoriella megaspora]|nr:MAG: hypothetical protein M1820_004979 [Bogoriella megaspora]
MAAAVNPSCNTDNMHHALSLTAALVGKVTTEECTRLQQAWSMMPHHALEELVQLDRAAALSQQIYWSLQATASELQKHLDEGRIEVKRHGENRAAHHDRIQIDHVRRQMLLSTIQTGLLPLVGKPHASIEHKIARVERWRQIFSPSSATFRCPQPALESFRARFAASVRTALSNATQFEMFDTEWQYL